MNYIVMVGVCQEGRTGKFQNEAQLGLALVSGGEARPGGGGVQAVRDCGEEATIDGGGGGAGGGLWAIGSGLWAPSSIDTILSLTQDSQAQ